MRYLVILGSASALALAGGEAGAQTKCVSPDASGCFPTIQSAVDAAAAGDTIVVRGKRDGTAYNEAVVISTPNLTIQGETSFRVGRERRSGPTFRSVAGMVEFGAAHGLTLPIVHTLVDPKDPDIVRWLATYPNAGDFRDVLDTLGRFIHERELIDRCPPVVVEVCDTPETGPNLCGTDSEVNVFTVGASGTTFANLTIRHGDVGIGLLADVTDTTVERSCFRNNNGAIESLDEDAGGNEVDGNNPRTTILQSFIDGASRSEGFDISGDDALIEYNLLLNTEGINVDGDGYQIAFNAASITTDDECFEIDGANGLLTYNIGVDCDGGMEIDDAVDTTVLGNLIHGVPDDDEGIDGRDVPEEDTDPNEPGNLRTIIKNNIFRLISDDGVEFGGNEGLIEGNLIERAGNDRTEAGLSLRGNNNQVLYNLIRHSSQRGIVIEGFFDATLGQDAPSSGNLIRGNVLTRNNTSGVHLPSGFNNIPQATDTTIDANIITRNEGEGVSIPQGDDDPPTQSPAANTTLTNNFFDHNRTDICNESPTTVIGAGNVFTTGGLNTPCVVEPGID